MFSIPVVGAHCHGIFETVRLMKIQEAWAITVECDSVYTHTQTHVRVHTHTHIYTHYILSIHRESSMYWSSFEIHPAGIIPFVMIELYMKSKSILVWVCNFELSYPSHQVHSSRGERLGDNEGINNKQLQLIVFCVLGTVLWDFHVDLI